MILYGSPISPFVRKVQVYAAERGIAFEPVAVGIGDPNPDFAAVSPFRKMPALRDGDFGVADSSAIIHYLEAKFPDGALIPAEAQDRARTIWFDEFADTIVAAAGGKIFFNRVVAPRFLKRDGDEALATQGEAELVPCWDYMESAIPASGYLVGDQFSLADISVASVFVNTDHVGINPDPARYPRLTQWLATMHARPTFAKAIARERKILGLA